jgi:hypothetical protein
MSVMNEAGPQTYALASGGRASAASLSLERRPALPGCGGVPVGWLLWNTCSWACAAGEQGVRFGG